MLKEKPISLVQSRVFLRNSSGIPISIWEALLIAKLQSDLCRQNTAAKISASHGEFVSNVTDHHHSRGARSSLIPILAIFSDSRLYLLNTHERGRKLVVLTFLFEKINTTIATLALFKFVKTPGLMK